MTDFGVKPELGTIHGEKHFKRNKSCDALQTNLVLQTLTNVVDFIWLMCAEIQKEAGLPPMGEGCKFAGMHSFRI